MIDLPGKESKFWTSPALSKRLFNYPPHYRGRVPMRVRTTKKIVGFMFSPPGTVVADGAIVETWVNSGGAVSAICANGELLGLFPSDFEVIDWYDPATGMAVKDDRILLAKLEVEKAELLTALEGMLEVFADDCEDMATVIEARRVVAKAKVNHE